MNIEPWIDAINQQTLLETAGRLHPMLLHMPIGLLALLALMEAGRLLRRRRERPEFGSGAVWLTAITGAAAAGTGWLLGGGEDYGGDTLELHRWLGIAVGSGCVLLAVAWSSGAMRLYRGLLILTLGLLVPAGHLGASMTHGKGFVTRPLRMAMAKAEAARVAEAGEDGGDVDPDTGSEGTDPAATVPAATNPAATVPAATNPAATSGARDPAIEVPVAAGADLPITPTPIATPKVVALRTYTAHVLPILDARCGSCHAHEEQIGMFNFMDSEGVLTRPVGGPVIGGSDPELLVRILLPLEDEFHMPPDGRRQLTDGEIGTLAAWIRAGAPFDEGFDGGAATAPAGDPAPAAELVAPPAVPPPAPAAAPAKTVDAIPAAADPAALAAVRARFATAAEIVPGQPGLRVDLSVAPGPLAAAAVRDLLSPLAGSVVELVLARTDVSAAGSVLARMKHLESLDLRGSATATDAVVASVAALPRLRELVLVSTPVTDAGLAPLASGAPALERLHLWSTAVTPAASDALRSARPDLLVAGDTLAGIEPLETEAPPTFTSDRPVPGAADGAGAAGAAESASSSSAPVSLAAVNSVCPVSGAPVDPGFRIVHGGRVIGFCCEGCVARFWADPSAFTIPERTGSVD